MKGGTRNTGSPSKATQSYHFMQSSSNQQHAHALLKDKLELAKNNGWTKKQYLEHIGKRGYLDTETDRKIVNDVLAKGTLKDDSSVDKQREMANIREKQAINKMIKESKEPLTVQEKQWFEK